MKATRYTCAILMCDLFVFGESTRCPARVSRERASGKRSSVERRVTNIEVYIWGARRGFMSRPLQPSAGSPSGDADDAPPGVGSSAHIRGQDGRQNTNTNDYTNHADTIPEQVGSAIAAGGSSTNHHTPTTPPSGCDHLPAHVAKMQSPPTSRLVVVSASTLPRN